MNKSTLRKFDFSLFCKKLIGIDKVNVYGVKETFERMKRLAIHFLFYFTSTAYLVIAYGYFKAEYYPLMAVTFVSLLVTSSFYVFRYNKTISDLLVGMLFIYIPITNIFIKDVFFVMQGNPLIDAIFLHTHFMLVLFISFTGLITHQKQTLYVGCISVVWVWVFSIFINDPYIWSLLMLDTVFFIGITLLIYFVYSSSYSLVEGYDQQERTIKSQNSELHDLMNFKDRMLHLFVHDIKNPINRIMTASHNEPIFKADIVEPGDQILLIIGNILDVHKLEKSKMELKLSVFNLEDVFQRAVRHVDYLCVEKKITLSRKMSVNHCIEADALLLERVFINLLSNAIKFSKPNSTIDIRLTQKNDSVRVEVVDTGEGIPEEDIDHIFDKYYQGKNQRAEFSHSSGLGLTFCKWVVEDHGGKIGVESVLNLGTTLWLELPVKTNENIPCKGAIQNVPSKYERKQLENKNILICKKQLAGLAVYQTGEILNLLNEHNADITEDFQYWKEELINASITGNTEYFNELRASALSLPYS